MFTFLTKHEIHFKETTTQTHTDRKEEGVDTKNQDDTSSKILCIREIWFIINRQKQNKPRIKYFVFT